MRLICTFNDQQKAFAFSHFLRDQGIENQLEILTNTDWGHENYGVNTCRVWVLEEEQLDQALQYAHQFQNDPSNSLFQSSSKEPDIAVAPPIEMEENRRPTEPIGQLTLGILILCCLLLLFSTLTSPVVKALPSAIPYTPILSSPVDKALMYDYPHAYEIIDKLVENVGIAALEHPENLSPEAKNYITQFEHTPYWQGFYPMLVQNLKNPNASWSITAPMFEKIQEGEVWRLITPIFLHAGIFHLFFNMIWLVVLGKQMEQRLKKWRYLLFILIAGIVSNTAQYLMSGSNFLGFSGVLCAMLTFIWLRQRTAAWEGYQLERGTMAFISFFILFMFSIQLISFFVETYTTSSLTIGIANTAHLTGAAVGVILSRLNFFSWRH